MIEIQDKRDKIYDELFMILDNGDKAHKIIENCISIQNKMGSQYKLRRFNITQNSTVEMKFCAISNGDFDYEKIGGVDIEIDVGIENYVSCIEITAVNGSVTFYSKGRVGQFVKQEI